MKTLSSLDIHYLVNELQFLVGSRVDKLYEKDKQELTIQFYVPSKAKQILKIVSGKYFYLAETKEDALEPSGFCMQLRKYLDSSRLRSLNQLASERIIELVFETKDKKVKLFIEFFSNGNIILTEENNMIITASLFQKWKDREIKPKLKYIYPKKDYNIFETSDISKMIKDSDRENIVKTLAIDLGLGGEYSELLCQLSNIDKNKKEADLIKDEIGSLNINLKKMIEGNPLKITSHKIESELSKDQETIKEDPRIKKIKSIIQKQEEKIKELAEKEIEEREKGDLIYSKYQVIDEILKKIKKASEKYSWKEIKDKLKDHNIIKEVNAKDKTILVDIKP